MTYKNNLHFGGVLYLDGWFWANPVCTFKDNIYDSCRITDWSFTPPVTGNNAYINTTFRLSSTNANDVVLSSLSYQTGPLGKYYQPTNSALINVGSQNATNAGLYHYTTLTNQVKETNTVVDIGFHYVALNSSGLPFDGDSDGLPDYFEDVNGNGSVDTGERSWLSADTDGDGVSDYWEWLLGRNPLITGTTNSASQTKLVTYTPLR